ncbi:glycoside hydrolase family 13 protein [Paraclostridium sordellii]|uniref:glycoside hydrolase family 13 protein n=1 Tax=Paraclostridium sordellii TaxID=1505 RepID=UPI0005EA2DD9|nr:glycoside hydrolase family 13 protein [Paeniclostridium sordellii]MBS6024504.1 glycoside hydrolase family 13 protein [Paeniclostridium sordellii]MBX9182511.1 glycoside hydrolase family 13 protein [Paeniclostridium sordellii]CEO16110.1 alpha-amylase [[Clostridium] sordellii] [Paeniclostridium sordellii]CEO31316.1 alpha-amylase [[Clostridium] sordellii] [Paeniclostridium sordellii]CEP49778.1 alpha-amylase [[Clostridium] sordellii] [Paeniclostridium sordellii]
MSIIYDSWMESHKKPFGALEIGEDININIEAISDVKEIYLILETNEDIKKEIKMENKSNGIFTIDKYKFEKENIYFYYFKSIEGETLDVKYYGKSYDCGECVEYHDINYINKYQITVSRKTESPKWFKEGILYHIFVDRFNRTGKINNPKKNSFIYANWEDTPMYIKNKENEVIRWDFHGGNLKGIISKLNYLKGLGVTVIYLSPIFKSQSNHKYDTGDYKTIDPMFGDEEIFKELIYKASKKGINIILDGVFSHTGDDSIYFNKYGNYDSLGAYQSKNSKFFSWYNFKDYPNEYDCWWGVKSLPNVNEIENSYMDYIIRDKDSVIKKWMNYGVKGWRLDVVDELPSKFLETLKKETLNIDNESVIVGEVWEDASNKISYSERRKYFLGNQLNGVTGYVFKNIVVEFLKGNINSQDVYNRFMTIKENYPKDAFKSNLNLLGTHDTRRILTELNEEKELLKLAVFIQMTFEGVPYVYYGDEAGLTGETDPDNRRTYPWENEDKDILNFYKKIIKERKNNKLLSSGETKFLKLSNQNILGYIRYIKTDKILVLINRSNIKEKIDIESNEFIKKKLLITLDPKSHNLIKID